MFLVDTNVLVYRHDPSHPAKQHLAEGLLREGLDRGTVCLAYQCLVEFVPAVTRPRPGGPLLTRAEALVEVATLAAGFPVLYPAAEQVLVALDGADRHGLSWFDACLWAYAEHAGIPVLYSEDFQHGRTYGGVTVIDPFRGSLPGVADR